MSANIAEFIKFIDIATKNVQIYSESHPRTVQAIDQAYQSLNDTLQNKEGVTISIVEGDLLVEQERIEKGNTIVDRFCRDLIVRNIQSLTFVKGITREELLAILRLLNLKPQRIKDQGGFEKVIETEGIKNVQANKIRYGIVTDSGTAMTTTDEMLLSQLLLTTQLGVSGDSGAGHVAQSLEKSLETNTVQDPAGLMFRVFQMIAQNTAPASNQEAITPVKERFLQIFRSFTPHMQGKLLLSAVLKTSAMEQSGLKGFYRELSPQDLEASILAILQDDMPESREFIDKLGKEGVSLSGLVQKKLEQAGLVVDPWEELLKKDVLSPEEIQKVPRMIELMLPAGKLEEADRLSKKLFGYLNTGTPEQKIAVIQVVPSVGEILSKNEKWKNLTVSLPLIVTNCFRKETNNEVLSAFLTSLLQASRNNNEISNFAAWQSLFQTIHGKSENNEFLANAVAQHIPDFQDAFVAEIKEGTKGAETALEYMKLCGRTGVEFFLDWLVEEEHQEIRGKLIGFLEQMDRKYLLPELEKRMKDSRWFVVRNMVTIVNKLNVREAPALLLQASKNPDDRIAKEIIKKLVKTCTLADGPLLLQLLENPDKSVRIQVIHFISHVHLDIAAPALIRLTMGESPDDADLRVAAYEALLILKAQGAIEPALRLLERKASGKDVAERTAAVKILGELNRDLSRSLLAKIAASDPNPETRAAAQTYL